MTKRTALADLRKRIEEESSDLRFSTNILLESIEELIDIYDALDSKKEIDDLEKLKNRRIK